MINKKYVPIWLFIATFITTTIAGAEWIYGKSFYFHHSSMGFSELLAGFQFSIPFLLFLTFHEFGHYFMAKYKKIEVSVPYYIPAWFVIFTTIGTFGAFIKIKQAVNSKKDYFDIGIAGPLAGFFIAVLVLYFGFHFLPTDDYIFKIHPEYKLFNENYRKVLDKSVDTGQAIVLGKSLIYTFFENTFANPLYIPHKYELTHYPVLVAGFLGLLFTSLNLLPIGQLDGGHILYALIGKKYFNIVSPLFYICLIFYSGLGLFNFYELINVSSPEYFKNLLYFMIFIYFTYLCFSKIFKNLISKIILTLIVLFFQLLISQFWPEIIGYSGFLAFGFLIGRFLGVYHPETNDSEPIGMTRKILGWLTLLIFVLCFSPNPIN